LLERISTTCSIATLTLALLGAGCSDEGGASDDPSPSGGRSSSGGSSAGGRSSSGGESGTGGSGEGGAKNMGGSKSSGGTAGNGGSTNGGKGGARPTGGGGNDAGESGSDNGGAGGSNSGDYGFSYRKPGSQEFSCRDMPVEVPDADWLCTFHIEDRVAYVYAQATAIRVNCVLSPFGTYEVELAQISIDGVVSPLANAKYDWGGGHHNDSLSFDYEGKTYKYYHSSIGFGFRSCQPMDCLNVYARGATTPETEGCSKARALPEVCVPIEPGGTHDPLIDTFQRCAGDSE
jgi:hypothetical protein